MLGELSEGEFLDIVLGCRPLENVFLIKTAESVPDLRELIGRRVDCYNRERRHSGARSIGRE